MEIKCQLDATDYFYRRSYCLLNMFQAPLCHHQELESIIQMVVACGIWCFGFQVVSMVWSLGLCVRFAGCPHVCMSVRMDQLDGFSRNLIFEGFLKIRRENSSFIQI
jgi:hypothetical protein